MTEKCYRIGQTYIDKGNPKKSDDQFMKWINIPNITGMMNSPGIRWLNYKKKKDLPAVLILVSKTATSSYHNPWEDIVDTKNGEIYYWGDAKFHPTKKCDDFQGNKLLMKVYNKILEGKIKEVPPVLFFSKPKRGEIIFEGLCVIDDLELTWFEDHNKPTRNYRMKLSILDEEIIDVKWLHSRVLDNEKDTPIEWNKYTKKRPYNTVKVWRKNIIGKNEQLPRKDSKDYDILHEIHSLDPQQFETFCVKLIEGIKGIKHEIIQTRYVKDRGFGFLGKFTLPNPLYYVINFKGEAKKYGVHTAVGPKDLSRLAARLNRGEYGLFLTLSYFTRQAQEELYEDDYPIKLINGKDIINFLKEQRIINNGNLNQNWLNEIIKKT